MKKTELASSSKLIQTAEGRHRGKTRSRNTWSALVPSPLGIALSKTLNSTGIGKKYLDQEHQSKATILQGHRTCTHTHYSGRPSALITSLKKAVYVYIKIYWLLPHRQTVVCHWTQSLLWMSSMLREEIWLGILSMGHKCEDLLIPWYLTSSLPKNVPGKQNFIALSQDSWIEPRGSLAYDLSHVLFKLTELFPCFILDNKVKSDYKPQKATCKKSYQKTPKKSND